MSKTAANLPKYNLSKPKYHTKRHRPVDDVTVYTTYIGSLLLLEQLLS